MPDTGVANSGRVPATPTWPFPVDDPYPAYARARAASPAGVGWSDDLGAWLVLSHAGVTEVLRSEAWSADPQRSPEMMARLAPGLADSSFLSRMLLFTDPPEHDRLRAAVNRFFTPRRVEAIRHRVASIVNAAFSGAGAPVGSGAADVDVLEEIAYPVPLAVICELFDVGTDTALLLREETPVMAAMLDLLAPPSLQADAAAAAMSAMMALVPIVAERRRSPGEDLLSVLVERLEPEEAVIMALLLLAAGHETTSALISNAVMALGSGAPPVPTAGAEAFVEEVLRADSPVQVTGRIAAVDHDLFGCPVRAGDQAVLVLGAANRDPDVFDDPDRFDPSRFTPGRPRAGHLAFGHGAHFCVGAALARIEAAEVVRHLAPRDWKVGEHERAASSTFRRMKTLQIRI
jgi:cytochrome P450